MKILWSVTLVASTLAIAGCGDDEPAVCEAREQVRASAEELRDYDLVGSGLDGFGALIEQLVGDLGDLRAAAAEEVAPEVDAVSAAVEQTRTAVGAAANPQDALAALQTGIADVRTALTGLESAFPECD